MGCVWEAEGLVGLSGAAVQQWVRDHTGRHSRAWRSGGKGWGDRDKAMISHIPGYGPTQATETNEARIVTVPQDRYQDYGHPPTAGGPETLCREKGEKGRERRDQGRR